MDGGDAMETDLTFEEAWPILQEEAINKLIDSLEAEGEPRKGCFTPDEYMRFYTIVYNVCLPKQNGEVVKMYNQYKKTFVDYISSKVLLTLKGKEDINLLTELMRSWKKYEIMKHWLSRFFSFLSRYYIPVRKLPTLEEMSNSAFYDLVFGEIKHEVTAAITSMINREREGEHIDNAFMKDVIDMYKEIGKDSSIYKYCGEEVENSRQALEWIANLYEMKDEESVQGGKKKRSHKLRGPRSKDKVSEVAQQEMINEQADKLEDLKLHHGPVA